MANASGSITSAQGWVTIDCSLNDTITFTPSGGSYTVEYPARTTAIDASASTQTLSVTAGGQARVLCISGSLAWSRTDNNDGGELDTTERASVRALVSNAWIQTTDGGIHTLSEVQSVVAATTTATAFTGACLFRGLVVRAIVGTPQTVTVYDNTGASGTPIATFTIAALGNYFWDGDQVTAGNGQGGRRQNTTGVHVVFSGGTSRTVDVMVEAD